MVRFGEEIGCKELHVADLHTLGDPVESHVVGVKLRQRLRCHLHASQIIRRREKDGLGQQLLVFLSIRRLGFARCHQAPAQTHQRGQLGPAHLVPQKIQQIVFTDPRAPAGQHRFEEPLVVSLVESTGLWVPKGAGESPRFFWRLPALDQPVQVFSEIRVVLVTAEKLGPGAEGAHG